MERTAHYYLSMHEEAGATELAKCSRIYKPEIKSRKEFWPPPSLLAVPRILYCGVLSLAPKQFFYANITLSIWLSINQDREDLCPSCHLGQMQELTIAHAAAGRASFTLG